MTDFTFVFTCHVPMCGVVQEWTSKEAAQGAGSWHVYEEHFEVWLAICGDRRPVDRRPEEYGRCLEGLEQRQERCAICEGRIEYLDPTGDGLASWWAHEKHPADGHDALPRIHDAAGACEPDYHRGMPYWPACRCGQVAAPWSSGAP